MSSSITYTPAVFAAPDGSGEYPIFAVRVGSDGAIHVVVGEDASDTDELFNTALACAVAVDWGVNPATALMNGLGGAAVDSDQPNGETRLGWAHGPIVAGDESHPQYSSQVAANPAGDVLLADWGFEGVEGAEATGSVWFMRSGGDDDPSRSLHPVSADDYAAILAAGNGSTPQHWDMVAAVDTVADLGLLDPAVPAVAAEVDDFLAELLAGIDATDDSDDGGFDEFLASLVPDADLSDFDDRDDADGLDELDDDELDGVDDSEVVQLDDDELADLDTYLAALLGDEERTDTRVFAVPAEDQDNAHDRS